MTMFGVFDLSDPHPDFASTEDLLTDWDGRRSGDAGQSYVYAFRDAAGSLFYIGKGKGNRAHDANRHRHGRLGYYIAEFLRGTYTVEIIRTGLSPDDAEHLESRLIEYLAGQLVNWNGNLGSMLTYEAVALKRDPTNALRLRYRAAADSGQVEDAITICREALAHLSKWESDQYESEIHHLEQLAGTSLAARVDLRMAKTDYVPHAPPLACECLSDLTRYLCVVGRPQEARREVEAFTARYPHGSFCDHEFHDHRYDRLIKVAVTKREHATLRRIERALGKVKPVTP